MVGGDRSSKLALKEEDEEFSDELRDDRAVRAEGEGGKGIMIHEVVFNPSAIYCSVGCFRWNHSFCSTLRVHSHSYYLPIILTPSQPQLFISLLPLHPSSPSPPSLHPSQPPLPPSPPSLLPPPLPPLMQPHPDVYSCVVKTCPPETKERLSTMTSPVHVDNVTHWLQATRVLSYS